MPRPGPAPSTRLVSAPPRLEGRVPLLDGRRLGYAEFGDPDGPLVLWFHGTPGARRQLPPAGRRAATDLGLRVVLVERPGVGESTDHAYRQIGDWPADAIQVADALGRERFCVVGLSGGGPYALACGARFPERVVAIGILGGLVPITGDDGIGEGIVALSRPFNGILTALRRPLGRLVWGLLRATDPFGAQLYGQFGRVMPEGDRTVLADPEIEAMFLDDLREGGRRQFQAIANDAVLFGRDWGFRLADVGVPVRWSHGDADPFVSLEQAEAAIDRLPDALLALRPGESHLGGFAEADHMLEGMATLWDERVAAPA